MKQDDDRGNLVGGFIVVDGDEVLAIKQSGQVTRSAIDDSLRATSRDTKGVKFVGVSEGDAVAVVARSVESTLEATDGADPVNEPVTDAESRPSRTAATAETSSRTPVTPTWRVMPQSTVEPPMTVRRTADRRQRSPDGRPALPTTRPSHPTAAAGRGRRARRPRRPAGALDVGPDRQVRAVRRQPRSGALRGRGGQGPRRAASPPRGAGSRQTTKSGSELGAAGRVAAAGSAGAYDVRGCG